MQALAVPTRRAMLERIARSGEITVVELTRGSGVTQGAVSQHLKSLKQAGLVAERPEGRKVYYRARPEGLAPLADWMAYEMRLMAERFVSEGMIPQAGDVERLTGILGRPLHPYRDFATQVAAAAKSA